MMWIALSAIVLGWSAAIVWALWRTRWITGAASGLGIAITVILAAQAAGAPQPVAYGLALALSIFLAGVMTMMGLIAIASRRLAGRD